MKYFVAAFLFILTCASCEKSEEDISSIRKDDKCLNTFMKEHNLEFSQMNDSACTFYRIHSFEGNLYFELICCVCDMDQVALDCDGNLFPEFGTTKWNKKVKTSDTILIKKG